MSVIAIGDAQVDVERGLVTRGGVETALTTHQRWILQALVEASGAVVPRERLVERLWGGPRRGKTRPVDAVVRQLRAVLDPEWLVTVRGVGYRLRLAPPRTNLPPPGPADPDALAAALAHESPWISLVGPPGGGKTAVARVVCAALAERLPSGAWWVDAEARSLDQVVAEVARLLGADPTVEAVAGAIARRPALALALDAVDGVPVGPAVGAWIRAGATVVTTSEGRIGPAPIEVASRPASDASLARAWSRCTPDEQQALRAGAAFHGAAPSEVWVAATGAPAAVPGLVDRGWVHAADGALSLSAFARRWLEALGPPHPHAGFVAAVAQAPHDPVDATAALDDAIALARWDDAGRLVEVLVDRVPEPGLIERLARCGPDPRVDRVRAELAARAGRGPFPASPVPELALAIHHLDAGEVDRAIVTARRAERDPDRWVALLAGIHGWRARALGGTARGPAAEAIDRAADALTAVGAEFRAAEARLWAAELWVADGERRAEAHAAAVEALATTRGWTPLAQRAIVVGGLAAVADADPEWLVTRLGPVAHLADGALGLAIALARAGRVDEALRWAEPALAAALDPAAPLPEPSPHPGDRRRDLALLAAERRGGPPVDRRLAERRTRDPVLRAVDDLERKLTHSASKSK